MQKLLLAAGVPMVFLGVLVAVEIPGMGWLGFALPVMFFAWLLRQMQRAPVAPPDSPAPVITPAEPGEMVDAIFPGDPPRV
jgi:hypothetical protein